MQNTRNENDKMDDYLAGRSKVIGEVCSYLVLDKRPSYDPESHLFYAKSMRRTEERLKDGLIGSDQDTVYERLLDGFIEEASE